jgi:hypothetical protein
MVTKFFSLAGIAALGGLVWMGCSSDDKNATTPGTNDAGTDGATKNNTDSGDGTGNGDKDSGTQQQPGVPVHYGECPAFEKCDSDPVGSWTVSGGCLSKDAFAPAKAQCPGLAERDVVITAEGTVEVTATNVKRKTAVHLSGSVTIPKTCAKNAPCSLVAGALQGGFKGLKFDKVDCTEAGTACDCSVASTMSDDTDDTWTKDNGTLTTASNPERTYDYCVVGNTIRYQETTDPNSPLQFVIEMKK